MAAELREREAKKTDPETCAALSFDAVQCGENRPMISEQDDRYGGHVYVANREH